VYGECDVSILVVDAMYTWVLQIVSISVDVKYVGIGAQFMQGVKEEVKSSARMEICNT
jgi:hypothetical protein